jgi:pimeloyl-ACP methyl ester carboxylesterase
MRRSRRRETKAGSARLAFTLASTVFTLLILATPGGAAAKGLPAGLPADAPPAATAVQPSLPQPSSRQWPFPNSFTHTSGTGRVSDGASLWSSFVFDDHGAALPAALPASEVENESFLAPYHGSYVYSNPAAQNDGADIVRAAVGLADGSTYWRVDWNTLANAEVPIAEWTFDTDEDVGTGASEWPAGANISSPGIDRALLVSSRGAWLINPSTHSWTNVLTHGGALTVDRRSQSFIVRVPESLMPVSDTWTVRLAAGVANAGGNGFATPTLAGGITAPGNMTRVYDVAFRTYAQEPPIFSGPSDIVAASAGSLLASLPAPLANLGLDGVTRVLTSNMWMEDAQADALATGDVSQFYLGVDWAQLAARAQTPAPLPTGYSVRWYVSRFTNLGGGLVTDQTEGPATDPFNGYNMIPTERSRVQPYAIYVPTDYTPSRPARLTLLLHANESDYNEYGGLDPRLIQQLCQDRYSICVMPEELGPSLDWLRGGQTDLWQVWRAVADTYAINPDETVVAGYSMGGSGTNIMATEHPDDFAGALVLDGSENFWPYANTRWVPFVSDQAQVDEIVEPALQEAAVFKSLGYRFKFHLHVDGEHLVFAVQDRFDDAIAALGEPQLKINPPRFSYIWTPYPTDAADGLGATGDYWIGQLAPRSAAHNADLNVEDEAISSPTITPRAITRTVITGPIPGVASGTAWSYGPAPATQQLTTVTLSNVAHLSINVFRAAMRTGIFTINTDGPTTLVLLGLAAHTSITVNGKPTRSATLRLIAGSDTIKLSR